MPQTLSHRLPAVAIVALAALVVGLLGVVAPAVAQDDPDRPTFEDRTEVSEVLLDVLVTDEDGNVIVGLGPEDFVVEEDGERQEVASVTFYSNRDLAEPVPEELQGRLSSEPGTDDRYFILFFEDQRAKSAGTAVNLTRRQLRAASRAQEWVRQELLPNDWVAVTSFDVRLKVQQDFTRNREEILSAIDNASRSRAPMGDWPSRRPDLPEDQPSLTRGLPSGEALSKATPRMEQALEVLAEAAGTVRGRKNLVLFSTGFGDRRGGPTRSLYQPDPRFYPPMIQALNDNNVAVYAMDLTPLGVSNPNRSALNQIADETGGRYFFNFTNFLTPLGQVTEETNGYYLLSYRSSHPAGETGYQEVEVRTVNPGFEVKTRDGYTWGADHSAPGASSPDTEPTETPES